MARWPNRSIVTTPIYYVNDAPHIGHAYTTLAADALARWRRLWGDDVVFLTGTDEHGLKIQRAAEEHGVSPREWADQTSERFREAWKLLDISNDEFIRTSEPRHYAAVTEFLQRVYDNGYIDLGTYEGLYCVPCEAYYTEDELRERELPDPRPPRRARHRGELLLPALALRGRACSSTTPRIPKPCSRSRGATRCSASSSRGSRDFSMSRTSITWGIPLPWDERHVTYVWFDALFNYCTAVGYRDDRARFDRYWPADYHLMAKDILRFHAVYWPAMLMAAGEAPPKHVFAHGYLLVGGEKMSKTRLNQIAPADLVAEFGSDGFRYHFLADQRFGPDGDFSYEAMVARYNADLANNFGNLANRVLNMAVNYCDGVVPGRARERSARARPRRRRSTKMTEAMTQLQYDTAFGAVWELIRAANSYIEESEPWKLNKAGDAAAIAAVLGDCLEALRIVALLASPVIPRAAAELWRRLGLPGTPEDQRLPEAAAWGLLPAGAALEKGEPLFPRLES